MNIAIAGSHGLIGNNLVTFFRKSNNNVSRIVRSKEQNGIFWDPYTGYINHEKLENYDVIINLCGEKIASLNPFFKNRDNIINSRVNTNLLLSKTINKLENPPKYFISASAAGIYEPSRKKIIESSNLNKGFLSQLALEWEEASRFFDNKKTKIVNLRLGQIFLKKVFIQRDI
jgi:Predicted nucleoside-diphosphate sugar epimerase